MKQILLIAAVVALSGCASTRTTAPTACTGAFSLPRNPETKQYRDLDQAVDSWTQCINDPQAGVLRAIAFKFRGLAYIDKKEPLKAIPDLEEASKLVPSKTGWEIIMLAGAYREAGQPDKALLLLQKMQTDHLGLLGKGTTPGMPTYYHLGWTLSELKRWPEATEAFSEGLTYQPDYGWAFLRRAVAYENQGDFVRAKNDADRSVELLRIAFKGSTKLDQRQLADSIKEPAFSALLKHHGYDSETVFSSKVQ